MWTCYTPNHVTQANGTEMICYELNADCIRNSKEFMSL